MTENRLLPFARPLLSLRNVFGLTLLGLVPGLSGGCGNDEHLLMPNPDGVGTCGAGQELCEGGCAVLSSDVHHCGACGQTCPAGQACNGGMCECQADLAACGSECIDTSSRGDACGDCDIRCGTGLKCNRGACAQACAADLLDCGTDCVDPDNNLRHCGSCGNACGVGQSCVEGACACTNANETACGDECVDTRSAFEHCGACSNPCSTGQICSGGVCTCPAGETCGTGGTGGSVGTGGRGNTGGALVTGGGTGTGGGLTGTGGMGTGGTNSQCSNTLPTDTDWDEATCDQWAQEAGECESQWFIDGGYCLESCGKCDSQASGGSGNTGGGGGNTGSGGTTGTGNPYGGVSNAEGENYTTRYWDCCKPSCGWSNQGNIHSCDLSNNKVGVNDQMQSVCDGGPAQTCHGMAPWAYSSELAFGFAAANGRDCGACYKLEFTGQGEYNAGDPGSQQIQGKVMIVKVTNRGAELGDGHFDLLIPGGGLGMFNGCTQALGIQEGDLGARNGGLITSCNGNVDCIRNDCMTTFANHPELRDGCLWSVDWFHAADNPRFRFERVDCPAELGGFN